MENPNVNHTNLNFLLITYITFVQTLQTKCANIVMCIINYGTMGVSKRFVSQI
jgi:hypothetical protein